MQLHMCSGQLHSLCPSVCKHFMRSYNYCGISLITGQTFLFKI